MKETIVDGLEVESPDSDNQVCLVIECDSDVCQRHLFYLDESDIEKILAMWKRTEPTRERGEKS